MDSLMRPALLSPGVPRLGCLSGMAGQPDGKGVQFGLPSMHCHSPIEARTPTAIIDAQISRMPLPARLLMNTLIPIPILRVGRRGSTSVSQPLDLPRPIATIGERMREQFIEVAHPQPRDLPWTGASAELARGSGDAGASSLQGTIPLSILLMLLRPYWPDLRGDRSDRGLRRFDAMETPARYGQRIPRHLRILELYELGFGLSRTGSWTLIRANSDDRRARVRCAWLRPQGITALLPWMPSRASSSDSGATTLGLGAEATLWDCRMPPCAGRWPRGDRMQEDPGVGVRVSHRGSTALCGCRLP